VRIIDEVIKKRQQYLAGLLVKFEPEEREELQQYLQKLHRYMKE